MNNKPQILLTNDDSINSPGLWAAARELVSLGYVHVVAPRVQQTSMGRAFPLSSDGLIEQRTQRVNGQDWQVYSVGASPAQAVVLATHAILERLPDLIVSGINYGENVASGLTISGTVCAALEGASMGIPGLAVSLQTPTSAHYNLSPDIDFSAAGYFTRVFAAIMLRKQMPFDLDVLKVDVPALASKETPWLLTSVSRQRYYVPRANWKAEPGQSALPPYEIQLDSMENEGQTDLRAIAIDGKVSVTPISMNLTSRVDFASLEALLRS